MNTLLPGLGGQQPSANNTWTPNRQQRRVDKAATLAALRAKKRNGEVDTATPTTDAVRQTINETMLGTVTALKQGLPGVDFLLIGTRHNGSGKADIFLKSSMPRGSELTAAEILEGLAKFFREQVPTSAPPETPIPDGQ